MTVLSGYADGISLKDKFTQNGKFSHYLLAFMLMDVSVSMKPLLNNWSAWGLVLKINETTETKQRKMPKYSLSGVIQVFGSNKIPNWLAKDVFTPFLKPNSYLLLS